MMLNEAYNTNYQRGIGLLELMLSLSIIAVLLVMATRYYAITHRSQVVNEAVAEITAIKGAVANWKADKSSYKDLGENGLEVLAKRGLLSPQAADSKNTWGGELTLAASGGNSTATLTLKSVPKQDCLSLEDKVFGDAVPTGQGCDDTTFTVIIGAYN